MKFVFNPLSGAFDYVDEGGSTYLPTVATAASLPLTDPDGAVRVALDTDLVYVFDATSSKWVNTNLTASSLGLSSTANGISVTQITTGNIKSLDIKLHPADATNPGALTATNQSIAGVKTFVDTTQSTDKDSGAVVLEGGLGVEKNINAGGTILGSNLSGTNTGDVSLGAVGASPNSNGASLSGQTLTLQPANASNPGVLTAGTQTIGGSKTFQDDLIAQQDLTVTGISYLDGGIDVSTIGNTLSIGSVNAAIINIGNASAVINFNGTVNNNNVTNLNVTDQLITINDGGGAGSASGAGIEIEEAGVITGYIKTSGDRNNYQFLMPNLAGIITLPGQASNDTIALLNASQALTNKTISRASNTLSGYTANAVLIADGSGNATSEARLSLSRFSTGTLNYVLVGQGASDSVYQLITNSNIDASAAIAYSKLALSNSIVDGDISSLAAITRSKLASGSANHVLINDGTGVMSSEAQLAISRGGTGISTAPSNGQLLIGNSGSYSVASLTAGSGISIVGGAGSITIAATVPPSSGDLSEGSFSVANNQGSLANVTGLAFSNAAVRSFKAEVSVFIDATSDLFEKFTLEGVQRGADWVMSVASTGDNSLINFDINASGQIQYTSGNYAGFSSGVLKYRAITTSV
jgi:hypothetical protein